MKYTEKAVIKAIQSQFTDPNAKTFLDKRWREEREDSKIDETGFCYWASHAYFHFMDGKNTGLSIKKWIPKEKSEGHFWIEKEDGTVVDLTSKQYGDKFAHYKDGKPASSPKNSKIQKFISLVEAALAS